MRENRDPHRGPVHPPRVTRDVFERVGLRMPRREPPLEVLRREPRIREDRFENAPIRLVEERRKERGGGKTRHGDLLARREKSQRFLELAVGRDAHRRGRTRLAGEVEKIAPREILEASERRMPRRERMCRDEAPHAPEREQRLRGEDLFDHCFRGVRMPESLQRVAFGEADQMLGH